MGGHGRPAISTNHPPRTLISCRHRTSVPTWTHTSVISFESSLVNPFQSRFVTSSPFQYRPCRRVRHTNVFASIASTNSAGHSLSKSRRSERQWPPSPDLSTFSIATGIAGMCSGLGAIGMSATGTRLRFLIRRPSEIGTRFKIRCPSESSSRTDVDFLRNVGVVVLVGVLPA